MSKRKHNVTELRKHQIMLRLNDSEFAEVSSRAKKFHQPIAVYVRNTILNPSLGTDYTKKNCFPELEDSQHCYQILNTKKILLLFLLIPLISNWL